jgi:hypothetical protein
MKKDYVNIEVTESTFQKLKELSDKHPIIFFEWSQLIGFLIDNYNKTKMSEIPKDSNKNIRVKI